MDTDVRRQLPRTDAVLADERLAELGDRIGRDRVKRAVVAELARLRGAAVQAVPDARAVAESVLARLPGSATSLRAVINATGVVLHTNLGRAPLSDAALDAVATAAGYVDVEFELADGTRAPRGRHALAALRAAVPDADGAHVVNNGAAALLLAVTVLAAGREVVVSRGELVEIGDGFRLPDLIVTTGARLREVGTTNRATLADYANAIGPETGCILKVHPSNFRISGFTRSVEIRELAGLAAPVVADVGSGLLAADPAIPAEPDVTSALRAGAALVTCSGDKLLGGPQAGLIFGRGDLVQQMAHHPLARAVRVDKITLAALEATVDGPVPPTARALHADALELRARCEALADLVVEVGSSVVPADGVVGGGGAPGVPLAGWAVALPPHFAAGLRRGTPSVVGRLDRDQCLLDLRCVDPRDDAVIAAAVRAVAAEGG
jgi:L-seryl-tRNA(Ser) seleniumtransferase